MSLDTRSPFRPPFRWHGWFSEGTDHPGPATDREEPIISQVITTTPLTGRVAVVTGASSGIGEATAERLAQLGAKVAVAARRKENLDALVARVGEAGGTALAVPLDVTDREAVREAAQRVEQELGRVELASTTPGCS
ncbi:SDR family NAD(P)-dependent oxidoreductase [Amycolatopsis sp. NPDC051371]|uniref:SDR family NAD(P)-dependent oxidoreductase n=1 Tax=Amycolatopsis sp. NPDC051371 TaxID=3155800 RepID=UPI0034270247